MPLSLNGDITFPFKINDLNNSSRSVVAAARHFSAARWHFSANWRGD
jgi:hypothetical protein